MAIPTEEELLECIENEGFQILQGDEPWDASETRVYWWIEGESSPDTRGGEPHYSRLGAINDCIQSHHQIFHVPNQAESVSGWLRSPTEDGYQKEETTKRKGCQV